MTQQHRKNDPIALRKQLIQMRLELNRQKIRHEGIVLLEPVEKLRGYKQRFMSGTKPIWAVAGVGLASFLLARKKRSVGSLLPMMRIAVSLLPLLMSKSHLETDTAPTKTDYPNTHL